MSANNAYFSGKRAVKPEALEYLRLGWEDARQQRPWNPDYDCWPVWAQNNYERGRLRAVNVRAAGLEPRAFTRLAKSRRQDGRIELLPSIKAQITYAVDLIGYSEPYGNWLPAE